MDSTNKKIFIIDVMAMAFRNFYAFGTNHLYNSKGLCTSSIYATSQFLLSLLEQEKPNYIIAAADSSSPTFRHNIYPQYKANRAQMPEELHVQIPYIFKLLNLLHIPVIKHEGLEADDIIGSIVNSYSEEKDLDKYILSADKDFMQLVDDRTFLYIHKKNEPKIIVGSEEVFKKFGCHPNQIVDFLSLIGDSSDNVPGVSGIGPKSASKLLTEFENIEKIYKCINDIPNKNLREKLIANKDNAFLSKTLVTLKKDFRIDYTLKDLEYNMNNLIDDDLLNFFSELEFNQLHKTLLKKKNNINNINNTHTVNTTDDSNVSSTTSIDSNDISTNTDTTPSSKDLEPSFLSSYNILVSSSLLEDLKKEFINSNLFSFYIETSRLDTFSSPIGISLTFKTQSLNRIHSFFIPLDSSQSLPISDIQESLSFILNSSKTKICFNLKDNLKALNNIGVHIQSKYSCFINDTLLIQYLLNPSLKNYSLDLLCSEFFHHENIPIESILDNKQYVSDINSISSFHIEKSYYILQLYQKTFPLLDKEQLNILQKLDTPVSFVLAKMEQAGVFIDTQKLNELSSILTKKLEDLEQHIYSIAGESFNIKSPSQVQYILFEKLKIQDLANVKKIKKNKSGYSTDISVLESFSDHPIAKAILEYRKLSTLENTYISVLPSLVNPISGRVHTHFNLVATSTGRLSSSDPNLQNIPVRSELGKKIRETFSTSSDDTLILAADYSQIELRLLAHFSQDPSLIKSFLDNKDIHRATASKIFNISVDEVSSTQRSQAKSINFGIVYGMGSTRLAKEINISNKEASIFLEKYFELFPKIKTYLNQSVESATSLGYTRTLLGRKRKLIELHSTNPMVKASAKNIAMNTPLQGTAADLIKLAMINIDEEFERLNLKTKMILQVHDELVFEVYKSELDTVKEIIKNKMENAMSFIIPIIVDIGVGKNWLEAH